MATGRLVRLHRGVYAIGTPTIEGRWMAAVLASGKGSLLSHRSAAALWNLRAEASPRVDVTVRGSTGRSRVVINVHSGGLLAPEDVASHKGVPCTSLARTLVDLAAVVDRRALERAVDRAEELRVFDLEDLWRTIVRCSGRRGVGALAAALDGTPVQPPCAVWPRSAFWRSSKGEAGLVVEVDGRTFHAKRKAFRHGRQRDRRLALVGLETRRYDAAEIIDDPARVVGELWGFLGRSLA